MTTSAGCLTKVKKHGIFKLEIRGVKVKRGRESLFIFFVLFLLILVLSKKGETISFNLIDLTELQAPTDNMKQGFADAAAWLSPYFDDSITINIQIGSQALGEGILGSTSTVKAAALYSDVRTYLGTDKSSANDGLAVANLQQADPYLDFLTNDVNANVVEDSTDITGNNRTLDVPRANLKALGLLGAEDPAVDATIVFSTNFTFDYDWSDGISGGSYDFVGVAAHEIGHALGFVSGVDIVDIYTGAGPYAYLNSDLNPYRVFSVLDLYRYSAESLALGILDLSTESAAHPYFSLDGGVVNLGTFASGRYNGDGRQASHFQDSLGLGIMDPTAGLGELLEISYLDILAFDAIGYDLATTPLADVGNQVNLGDEVFITFANVTTPGGISKTSSSNNVINTFLADPMVGAVFAAYDITTTTTFAGDVTLEMTITQDMLDDAANLYGFGPEDFRIFRLVDGDVQQLESTVFLEAGAWKIRATTPGFSNFALGVNPEPATLILLGSFLLGLFPFLKRISK